MHIISENRDILLRLEEWVVLLPPGSLRESLECASQSIAAGQIGKGASDALAALEHFIAEMTGHANPRAAFL